MPQRRRRPSGWAPRGVGLTLVVLAWFHAPSAHACACCTNEGQRNVATVALDAAKRQEIESVRFADKATLFTGEADVAAIEGIATPSRSYDLTARWTGDRLVLSFRDNTGHTGTLSLTRPNTISVFEVDPRDRPDAGQGPTLYKEWKFSAPASGSGVFLPGIAPRQILTLILQGTGNGCTSGIDFSHWTLVMQGPKANYTLIGELMTAR